MTEQFFWVKELAARKIDAIPGRLNLIFLFMEITVDGSRKTSKRKRCCHLVFQSHSLQKENCKITFLSHVKTVLRGLHAEPWDKYISVADEGKVLGTWVDLREGETFGNTYQTVIDASKGIFVPRGVAKWFPSFV